MQERLFTAALELIAHHGYDNTSIDDIAAHADVARGTFFNHYPHKDDLITEWNTRRATQLHRALTTRTGELSPGDTLTRFHHCLAALTELNEQHQQLNRTMITAAHRTGRLTTHPSPTARLFTAILTDGQKRGEITEDLDPHRLGHLIDDTYHGVLTRWADPATPRDTSLYRELHEAFKTFLTGTLPRPAHPGEHLRTT
ncbi:TetR/AcrR family transcriptional regulator [Streptomyces sp. NPDC051132]|uniref:TetR/AcrR family transcriptional regulator n=1 Tax=unclassified Streptomyces TaxID=2593676 RepID=UPI003443BAE8